MREIKFRVHKKLTNEYFCFTLDELIENEYSTEDIVGQYTGLKDKNGVEIYEADVVKAEDGVWKVLFLEKPWDGTGFVLVNKEEVSGEFDDNTYHIGETEVIGNIYENPELLEENARS